MQRSETIAKLAEALSKTQGLIRGAVKDSSNPFFKQKYADLASIWDACREPLSKNGLAVSQLTEITEGDGVIVETILMHVSGEWIMGRLTMPVAKHDAQAVGSAITYARRYALAAIVGVAPEDDDAQKAMPANSIPKKDDKKETQPAHFKFLAIMNAEKERIGERDYYKILGSNGFEHANQILTREAQIKVHKDLKEITDEIKPEETK